MRVSTVLLCLFHPFLGYTLSPPSRASAPLPVLLEVHVLTPWPEPRIEDAFVTIAIDGNCQSATNHYDSSPAAGTNLTQSGNYEDEVRVGLLHILAQIERTVEKTDRAGITTGLQTSSDGAQNDSENETSTFPSREDLVGDWLMKSSYSNSMHESVLRMAIDDDNELALTVIMPNGTMEAGRVRFKDGELRFRIVIPFVTSDAATVAVNVTQNEFKGTVTSDLGEIPLAGERVDTTKLIVAAYDPPDAVVGNWDVHTVMVGSEFDGVLTISERDAGLHAVLKTEGHQYDSIHTKYKKVSETMSVVRISFEMPELGDKTQVFELVVNGDDFEGEELYSNGNVLITGSRAED